MEQYYETAANLGDTGKFCQMAAPGVVLMIVPDAMNEVAWCYLEGFGCKKDKVRISQNFPPGLGASSLVGT